MKIKFFHIALLLLTIFSSCRKEEMEFIDTSPEDTIEANSSVAMSMQRIAMKDGSPDNIIDQANCLTVDLPVTVVANGTELIIATDDDYSSIEAIFDDSINDVDFLEIYFPITVIFSDYSTTVINNQTELTNLAATCTGENEIDDDIECLDFVYPLNLSIFNLENELLYAITLLDDSELYTFIASLTPEIIAQMQFPISIQLFDNTQMVINNLNELESAILSYGNECDEDDDYDYDDDDCIGCNPNLIVEILTNCSDWSVDKLERNGNDYDDLYIGYVFNFYTDDSLSVTYGSNTIYGTWSTADNNGTTIVVINIPSLPYCNNDWILHELDAPPGETKVDLRLGDDRIRYENYCN